MNKQFDVIPVEDYAVVVDNSIELQEGEKCVAKGKKKNYITNYVRKAFTSDARFKMIATIGKRIEGLPLIELPYQPMVLARESAVMNNYDVGDDTYKHGVVEGYEAAQSKGVYTEEDMRVAHNMGYDSAVMEEKRDKAQESLGKYLSKPKFPTSVILEMEVYIQERDKPRTARWEKERVRITNPETNTIIPKEVK